MENISHEDFCSKNSSITNLLFFEVFFKIFRTAILHNTCEEYSQVLRALTKITNRSEGRARNCYHDFKLKEASWGVSPADISVWTCSPIYLRNSLEGTHFTMKLGWLLKIRVTRIYCSISLESLAVQSTLQVF